MRSILVAIASATLVLLALTFSPSEAGAQSLMSSTDGAITVIQPKPVLRRGRLQLSPRFGIQINDAVVRQWAIGGTLRVNATEQWSVASTFEWMDFNNAVGGVTPRYEEVISATSGVPDVGFMDWVGTFEVGYVPLYGKGVLFNRAVVFWDLYLSGGPAIVSASDEIRVGGVLAVGVNLYFNRWIGLQTEFRDRIARIPSGDSDRMTNVLTSSIGLTLFLPPSFRYRYADGEGAE
ncbi:MAG: outer membrane beta-barrel protein [Bradymonadia bacterium]|jgi:outer membrane beta-barrel protein